MIYSTKSSTISASENSPEKTIKKELTGSSPLLIPLLSFLCGILFSEFTLQNHYLFPLLILFIISGVIFLLLINKKQSLAQIPLLLTICLSGSILHNVNNYLPANNIIFLLEKKEPLQVHFKGLITDEPVKTKYGYRMTSKIITMNDQPVNGQIMLSSWQDSLQAGDVIETLLSVQSFKNSNPGLSDQNEHFRRQNIHARATCMGRIKVSGHHTISFLNKVIIKIRTYLQRLIRNKFPSDYTFVQAILLGDKSGFDYENTSHIAESVSYYQLSGLMHILAVSGFHTSVLYLTLLITLSIINRKLARLISLLVLPIYAGLCLWSPSVTRAAVMICLYIISSFMERKQSFWQIFSLVLFIILIADTNQLFDIGLLLSCLAVIGIQVYLQIKERLCASNQRKKLIKNWYQKIIFYLTESIVLTIIICLFTAPILIYYFYTFNLNSLFGNLLLVPLFALMLPLMILILIVPIGYFPFNLLLYTWYFLKLIFEKGLYLTAKLPFIQYLSINTIQLMLLLILLFYLTWLCYHSLRKWGVRLSVILLLCLLIWAFQSQSSTKTELIVFNTGTSDASLIMTKTDETIVIDTGDIIEGKAQIENSLIPYLHKTGKREIDYLVITHPHQDHFGGLKALARHFKIRNMILTNECLQDSLLIPFHNIFQKSNLIIVSDTFRIKLKDSEMKILHPDKGYHSLNPNNNSITLRWSDNRSSFLFTGDIEKEAIDYICQKYGEEIDSDLIKYPHHGSQTGLSQELLDQVSPETAIITVAKKNRFNFPSPKVINLLKNNQVHIHCTGQQGAFVLRY